MSTIPPGRPSLAAALSQSLIPSDIPDSALPFGPPPPKLLDLETNTTSLSAALRGRVRALADNANRVRYRSAQSAAQCWHEAGRLLAKRAARPAEAWVCYSRALIVFPDFRPSLTALRRLARQVEAKSQLAELLQAYIDRTTHPIELALLHLERAVLAVKRQEFSLAVDALKEALRAKPDFLAATMLKGAIAALEADDAALIEALSALAQSMEPKQRGECCHLIALLEERLGRFDSAYKNLDFAAGEGEIEPSARWLQFKLCLKLGKTAEALRLLDKLVAENKSPAERFALSRFNTALRLYSGDLAETELKSSIDSQNRFLDTALFLAERLNEHDKSLAAARVLKADVRSPQLIEALDIFEISTAARLPNSPPLTGAVRAMKSRAGRAMALYFGVKPEGDESSPRLYEALAAKDSQATCKALAGLRERSSENQDRWALAVAESAVLAEYIKDAARAVAVLRSETDRLNRAPLPAIIRSLSREHEDLAALAIAEAEDSDDDPFKSSRFAWAAHHFEFCDKAEAGRLYRRSLEIEPNLLFAVAGLERTIVDRQVLADACAAAAEISSRREMRLHYLIRAGLHALLGKEGGRAAECLSDACEIAPLDNVLRETACRLALNNLEAASPSLIEQGDFFETLPVTVLLAGGTLGLQIDPHAAVKCFEKALAMDLNDPIAKAGLREALESSDRLPVVLEELFARLRTAEKKDDIAALHQELATLCRWSHDDLLAAVSSWQSIVEVLPGQRSALIRLAVHFLSRNKEQELHQIYAALAKTAEDAEDARAFASAAWRAGLADPALLRIACRSKDASLLDLTELEAQAANVKEREKILSSLANMDVHSGSALSRLADLLSDKKEYASALELRERALHAGANPYYELFAVLGDREAQNDNAARAETLQTLAAKLDVVDNKVEMLLKGAIIALHNLGDLGLAIQLCTRVLKIIPENDESFALGRGILDLMNAAPQNGATPSIDKKEICSLSIDFLEARLPGARDAAEKHKIHLELADLLLVDDADMLERVRGRGHIKRGLEIDPEDLPNRCRLATLHLKDQEWNEGADELIIAAHQVKEMDAGIPIFYTLGQLYMDHLNRLDLAEKSFIKVLGWDRGHFGAWNRIADLYMETGNWARARKALEQLINLTPDNSIKIEKIIALSAVTERHFGDVKAAEQLLSEGRRLAPDDFRPIGALAAFFERQGDPVALNIHLDSALLSQATLLSENPDRTEIYGNIQKILTAKGEEAMALLAFEAMELADRAPPSPPSDYIKTVWSVGPKLADPTFDTYLCPKAIPAGLRATLKLIEEPLAQQEGVSAKQLRLGQFERLKRTHPLAMALAEAAPIYGFDVPPVYAGLNVGLRVSPGSPPAVVVPPTVIASDDPAVVKFTVAASLTLARLGLGLLTMIPLEKIRLWLGAAVQLALPQYLPEDMSEVALNEHIVKLREILTSRTIEQIRPLALDCIEAPNRKDLDVLAQIIACRAGFIGTGSLKGAIAGLRAITGKREGPLSNIPGAGALIAFIFSRDHFELRQRMAL